MSWTHPLDFYSMQMFLLRSIMVAILALTLIVSGNVIDDLNCKAQTAAAEAQLQNEVFVEGLIRCLKSNNPRQECDKEGLKARRLAPMVLQGICPPPCNKCIARLMRMVRNIIIVSLPSSSWRVTSSSSYLAPRISLSVGCFATRFIPSNALVHLSALDRHIEA